MSARKERASELMVQASADCIRNGVGLLINFLEHVMSKPLLLAAVTSQVIREISRSTGTLETVRNSTFSGVRTPISPSLR